MLHNLMGSERESPPRRQARQTHHHRADDRVVLCESLPRGFCPICYAHDTNGQQLL